MRASILRLGWLVVASAIAAGCGDSPTAPGNPPFSQNDVRVGTGADAVAGRVLTVNYTGWLYNGAESDQKGAQFDSSVGATPFSFTLGAGQVIEGWDRGAQGMKVGGIRRLIIPPSLGYGAARRGPIPPNATLLFELELIAVN